MGILLKEAWTYLSLAVKYFFSGPECDKISLEVHKNLIFLDTETTGIDPLVDRLVQVAYKIEDKMVSSLFKPPVPISVKSMSISHITNKMVEDKELFVNSQMKNDLNKLLRDNILVAHNAGFDVDILYKEGIKTEKYIDTLKIVKYLDPDNKIPEYGLQYLRYFLGFELDAKAHDAVGDVIVLEKLFEYLFTKMRESGLDEQQVIDEMIDVSSKPLLLSLFNYGKHKGKKVEEVLAYDRNYLEWMLQQKLDSDYYDEDWIYTLKHHLKIE